MAIRKKRQGLEFQPMLLLNNVQVDQSEQRDALITNSKGETVFEQKGVIFPPGFSQMAVNIVASKYFHGQKDSPDRENSFFQLVNRISKSIGSWGSDAGYFDGIVSRTAFEGELRALLIGQYCAFNSPVNFNVGVTSDSQAMNYHWNNDKKQIEYSAVGYTRPQASACFINSVNDSMESILELNKTEGMLFKWGSGAGVNLSPLRSSAEQLSSGGIASGPVSFMRGFDAFAGVIKSGGTTRRAAKMIQLNTDHPDIEEFIACKGKEEAKAQALMSCGYDGTSGPESEAYLSVSFQNANNSVRATDAFMELATEPVDAAIKLGWNLKSVKDDSVVKTVSARDLLMHVAEQTHKCGDPGMQFDTTINNWHTCKQSGRINASNPCAEFMFLDDTACNLASFNLLKFYQDGEFNVPLFKHAINILTVAMDIIVDGAGYPTEQIAKNSHDYRPLGLGYANLGALLMEMGYAYDSDDGRNVAAAITAVLGGQAYLSSANMAFSCQIIEPANAGLDTPLRGTFPAHEKNDGVMLDVIDQHYQAARDYVEKTPPLPGMRALRGAALHLWQDAYSVGQKYGYRNSQVTVLAPTGTIGFMMDCDTTGVEPMMSLVTYKKLVGGGFAKLAYPVVERALRKLGYSSNEVVSMLETIEIKGTVVGGPFEPRDEDVAIFDCALPPSGGGRSISWLGHIKMMEAVQPFLSGAISKTVNMPKDSTVQDVFEAYVQSWKRGLKAVAIYRDGSKTNQPVVTSKDKVAEAKEDVPLWITLSGYDHEEISAALWNGGLTHFVTDPQGNLLMAAKSGRIEAAPAGVIVTQDTGAPPRARRHKLPDTRPSIIHKFVIAGHEGYLHVGLYPDKEVGEIFITMAKEGSTLSGIMDAFATVVSIGLQHGVPLVTLIDKMAHTRYEPSGWTGNPDIGFAKSITDYIFRWLKLEFVDPKPDTQPVLTQVSPEPYIMKFAASDLLRGVVQDTSDVIVSLPGKPHQGAGHYVTHTTEMSPELLNKNLDNYSANLVATPKSLPDFGDAPPCSNCGAIMRRSGSCYACASCGGTSGCS